MRNSAIVVAAGLGKRFGRAIRKQYILLGDRSILEHSLLSFESAPEIADIVVVLDAGSISELEEKLKRGFSKIRKVIPGGLERQDSVAAGFRASLEFSPDIVCIHDGARPFLAHEILKAVLEGAREVGAAIPVIPVIDTIKRVSPSAQVTETLERRDLYRTQTPQAFRTQVLKEALERAEADGVVATDESFLVERIGRPVKAVEGSEMNVKVTTLVDLQIAQCLRQQIAGKGKQRG
jgi:2-C-methyl-D-erythritol 4-phosphate cytidylyltransferase